MSNPESQQFDCVRTAREARDRLSAEIEDMSHEQLVPGCGRIDTPIQFWAGWRRRLPDKPIQRPALRTGADRRRWTAATTRAAPDADEHRLSRRLLHQWLDFWSGSMRLQR